MPIQTYVNEVVEEETTWVLTFGSPYMNYDGPTVVIDEETARAILATKEWLPLDKYKELKKPLLKPGAFLYLDVYNSYLAHLEWV